MSELLCQAWQYGDAGRLNLREPDKSECAHLNLDEDIAAHPGPKWTLWHEQEPALCFGYVLEDGIATLWALSTDLVAAHPKGLSRHLVQVVDQAFHQGAHRVQALVLEGNERSCRWLQRFGRLGYEGLLMQFGPDRRNRHILARVLPSELPVELLQTKEFV